MRKPEFSKVIALIAIVCWIIVNVYGMVMMAVTMDLSPLVYVIGSADAVVAVVYAVYAHKAKIENVIKLKKIYGMKITQDDFGPKDSDARGEDINDTSFHF